MAFYSTLNKYSASAFIFSKGCLDDSDCSEYGTECNLNGIHKHTCVLKKCPSVDIENGNIETHDKTVKDVTVLSCRKGFIYKSPTSSHKILKHVILLCSINSIGEPTWVEKEYPGAAFAGECVEGKDIYYDC